MVSLTQFVVWIIVGLLGGSIAGLIIRRERRGFGVWRNLGLGLVGALVGGLLFWMLGLFPDSTVCGSRCETSSRRSSDRFLSSER